MLPKRMFKIYMSDHGRLCQLLTNQGIDVVICTIAMFDEIRDWNRKNIANHLEVFLDVDYEVLRKRNKKGLYASDGKMLWVLIWRQKYRKSLILSLTLTVAYLLKNVLL